MTTAGGLSRFPSFDGREIAYLDTGGAPEAPLALLLHGFASTHHDTWVEPGTVDALAATGRRVVAWDARGHGASARPHEVEAYTGDAMVRDAGALLDHVGVTGRRSVDVVGYSMGSVVSTRWVPADERVRSVVPGDHPTAMTHPELPAAVVEFVTTTPSEVPAP